MPLSPTPMCTWCRHLDAENPRWTCAAYPTGIPVEILDYRVDHRRPYAGDHNLQFTAVGEDLPEHVTAQFQLGLELAREPEPAPRRGRRKS